MCVLQTLAQSRNTDICFSLYYYKLESHFVPVSDRHHSTKQKDDSNPMCGIYKHHSKMLKNLPYKVLATISSLLPKTRQGPFHFSITITVPPSSPELSVFAIV